MKIILCLTLLLYSGFSRAQVSVKGKAQAELQQKTLTQSKASHEVDPSWEGSETLQNFYGNFDGALTINHATIDVNWFVRHSQSDLFKSNSPSLAYANYPGTVVSRDVFKMEKIDEEGRYHTDSIVNKAVFDWQYEDTDFTFGRMFINYGSGVFYNPINPFDLPMGFSSLRGIHQGNDGLKFSMARNEEHSLNFYILGDQKINDYNGQISRTIWMQGNVIKSKYLSFIYTIGEDQKRQNLGIEGKYILERGKFYAQYLSQSKRVDEKENSERLHHFVIGYEQKLHADWLLLAEIGRQDMDEKMPSLYPRTYFPMEHFTAASLSYLISDALKATMSYAVDPKTVFGLGKAELEWQIQKNLYVRGFAMRSHSQDHQEKKYFAQRNIANEVGLALGLTF